MITNILERALKIDYKSQNLALLNYNFSLISGDKCAANEASTAFYRIWDRMDQMADLLPGIYKGAGWMKPGEESS